MSGKKFPCSSCGAKLEYEPGSVSLKCPYCGVENAIPQVEGDIRELDFTTYLSRVADEAETIEQRTVKCRDCGAESTVEAHITTSHCPFCGSQLMDKAHVHRQIKPAALLPFKLKREEAQSKFREWIRKLRFAPSKLKQYARQEARLKGMYIPHWTFDCNTTSHYTGERGMNYVTTETYRTKDSNGNYVTRTRQVTKIRWTPVSGIVWDTFDDVLVVASSSLPRDKAEQLEPWDLAELVPYQDEYLSGYQAEAYQIDLASGFERGKELMDIVIRRTIRRDIGGDHQRIHSVKTQHDNITFKHILLPIWLSAYRFKNKVYRFLINARTGEVQGERPWSPWKIALAVLAALAVIGVVYYFAR